MSDVGTIVSDDFTVRIKQYDLAQLEDVFSHLDREAFPERFLLVQEEIRSHLAALPAEEDGSLGNTTPGSILRRLWGSGVDLFVSLLPTGAMALVLIVSGVVSEAGGGARGGSGRGSGGGRTRGRGRPGRGGEDASLFWEQATDFLTDPDQLLALLVAYGPYYGGLVLYRALMAGPQWARSGSSSGLREAGVRIVTSSGEVPGFFRCVLRVVAGYVLHPITLGLTAAWALVDRQKRTVADLVAGVRVIRADPS